MRLSTKIIISAWVLLLGIIGSLILSAYSRLKPESLVSLLNGQIESNYPGSKLNIGKVNYHFALDFSLTLENLKLIRADKLMAEAEVVQLKVPWWLILMDRGSAQLNLNNLIIYVQSDPDIAGEFEISGAQKKKLQTIKLNLPSYLKDAIYTLRAKDITIKEQDGERRFFSLSKLLVRDFQYGKNSAFEINIPISISHKSKNYSSDLWLFGDITPGIDLWSFNYRGEFRTKDIGEGLYLDDLVIRGQSRFNPLEVDLSSDLELKVHQKSVGKGQILARDDKMTFDLDFNGFPISYLDLIGHEIKNPYLDLKSGKANGKVKYSKSLKSEGLSLIASKLNFPGFFKIQDKDIIQGQWSLSIENDKWETNFISPKGEVSFFRRAVIDFEQGKVKQSSQELGFLGLSCEQVFSVVKNFSDFLQSTPETFNSTLVRFKRCVSSDQLMDGEFKYSISPFENFYLADLSQGTSLFKMNYLAKNGLNQLSIEGKNFKWFPFYHFLTPFFESSSTTVSGKLTGSWFLHWNDGRWESSLQFQDYEKMTGSFLDPFKKSLSEFGEDFDLYKKFNFNSNLEKNTIKIFRTTLSGTITHLIEGLFSFDPSKKSFLEIGEERLKNKKRIKKEINNPFMPEV